MEVRFSKVNYFHSLINCSGFLVLGLVIIGALIIVAVKQSESKTKPSPDQDRQRNMNTTNDVINTIATEDIVELVTTTQSPETYQEKLRRLYSLITECNRLGSNSTICSGNVLGEADETTIDDMIDDLKRVVTEAKFNETVESFESFSGFIGNLTKSPDSSTNTTYASVMQILSPFIIETPGPRSISLNYEDDHNDGDGSVAGNYSDYSPAQEVQCDQLRER